MRKVSWGEKREEKGARGTGGLISAIDFREIIRRGSSPRVNTDASLRSRTFIRYIDRLIYRHDPVRTRSFSLFTGKPSTTNPAGSQIGRKSAPPNSGNFYSPAARFRQRDTFIPFVADNRCTTLTIVREIPWKKIFRRVRSQTNEKNKKRIRIIREN